MKQRAISIALVLVSLASVGASLFVFAPQTTYAYNSPSPNPASTTWCTSQYGSSTGTESTNVVEPLCEIGFMAPANKTSESTACGAANNYSQAEEAACEAGYNYARNLLQVCGSYPNNTSACHTGFINAGDSSGADACQYSSTISVAACSTGYAAGGGSTINTPPSSTTPSSNDSDLTCEAVAGGLGWLICEVVKGINGAEQYIVKNVLDPLLKIPAINFNSCNNGNAKGCDPTDIYSIWSSFRTYGDIILVIALLVVVFGESIGGGLIDAYTAKKVLPRILLAAILINLSIYIVAVGIDISNVLGSGIQTLITSPLGSTNHGLDISISSGIGAGGIAALFGVGAGLWVAGFSGVEFIALTLLLPLVLATIGVIVTLLIRRALIVFLVFISPIAFALYVLPNTEQFFKKWWDVFFKTLLIYPIVGVLFGMSTVMGVILNANATVSGTGSSALGQIMSIIALVIPLFLIPFSFRFAGSVIGTVHEQVENHRKRAHGMIAGDVKDPNSRRNRLKRDSGTRKTQLQMRGYNSMLERKNSASANGHRGRRALYGFAASRVGGYNLDAAEASTNAGYQKEVEDMTSSGRDRQLRALTVNKAWADKQPSPGDRWRYTTDASGNRTGKEYKTLGGSWQSEADVDAAHSRYGKNGFVQQAALSYEMRKASSEDDIQNLAKNYHEVAQGAGGWNMTTDQARGAWSGGAFQNQNQHLEYKYTDWGNGSVSGQKANDFVNEIYEKRGSYPMAQMSSNTIEQLKTAHTEAVRSGNVDQQEKIAAISQTFMHEIGSGAGGVMATPEGEPPIMGGGAASRRQSATPGAAHVAERVRELAVQTGVYTAAPTGAYASGHAPTPNNRDQV